MNAAQVLAPPKDTRSSPAARAADGQQPQGRTEAIPRQAPSARDSTAGQNPSSHAPASSPASPSIEGTAQIAIMLMIGAAAGAGSFRHVHDVAAAHGQAGWLAWADAIVLELMSIASGLELRRRKRRHESTRFPAAVMAIAVVLSLSAQVVEAERSVIGWVAAAISALGFLVMVKIALARSSAAVSQVSVASDQAQSQPESASGDSNASLGQQQTTGEDSRPSERDPVVEVLIPAARAAAMTLHQQKRRITRKALADVLRADGYGVSNARASELST